MDPVKAEAVKYNSLFDNPKPGQYCVKDGYLLFCCPCGCGSLTNLPIDGSRVWQFNLIECSITPSIRQLVGCKYHGFLTEGFWIFCGDSGN